MGRSAARLGGAGARPPQPRAPAQVRYWCVLGTQRRFAPGLRYLKDLLGDGYVGRVRSVRMHVTVSGFGKNRSKALRWSAFPENFMGVTSIFGAHLMDPLFSIVGRPTEISAVSVNQ